MDSMEDYKEKTKKLLSGLSFSTEDSAFWEEILDRFEPEALADFFDDLQAMTPEEIKFMTRIAREEREAILANDLDKFDRVLAEELADFKVRVLKYLEAKNNYCRQKVKEKAVSQN